MDGGYEVTVQAVAARRTTVVKATTTWTEFPTLWAGPAWPRWEFYGPHRDDPAELETQAFHMISA